MIQRMLGCKVLIITILIILFRESHLYQMLLLINKNPQGLNIPIIKQQSWGFIGGMILGWFAITFLQREMLCCELVLLIDS